MGNDIRIRAFAYNAHICERMEALGMTYQGAPAIGALIAKIRPKLTGVARTKAVPEIQNLYTLRSLPKDGYGAWTLYAKAIAKALETTEENLWPGNLSEKKLKKGNHTEVGEIGTGETFTWKVL